MMTRLPLWLRIFGILMGVALILPTLVVIPMSFSSSAFLSFPPQGVSLRWYQEFFTDPIWMRALWQSLQIALMSAALSAVLGVLTALAIVRGDFPGRQIVQTLVLSPVIMPVIVLAIAVYMVYTDWRILGTLGSLVLAHTVIAYPLVYIAVSTSLSGLDHRLELAAQSLGASRWTAFRTIALPLIAPGVLSGSLFAFVTSWDELILSIFLSSPTVKTLPVLMWQQVQTELSPTLAVAATLVLVTTIALILGAALILGRKKVTRS